MVEKSENANEKQLSDSVLRNVPLFRTLKKEEQKKKSLPSHSDANELQIGNNALEQDDHQHHLVNSSIPSLMTKKKSTRFFFFKKKQTLGN